jgi:anhydro-N-acetylmuramic acid kinase
MGLHEVVDPQSAPRFPRKGPARRPVRSQLRSPTERLRETLMKNSRDIIGLMSGMSMDGVNLAHVRVSGEAPGLKVALLGFHYRPYPALLRERLEKARVAGSARDICQLNALVGEEFAACVEEFLRLNGMDASEVDAIGSHGQTIIHIPPGSDEVASTLQIGSGSVIAQRTRILTVSNFRQRDMAVGGQGAPLVPLVDYLLFSRPGRCIALNNLGSISNVTVVPPNIEDLLGFDTGPANMPIDFFARHVEGNAQGFDVDGAFSARGSVIPELLKAMLDCPFFELTPPKSAGYQEFGPAMMEHLRIRFAGHRPEDFLRTAVELSAETLSRAYERFILPRYPSLRRVIFSGGGVRNLTLMRRIRERLPQLCVETSFQEGEEFGDAKEALAFAVLANETLSGRPTCIPQATGASEPVVSGEIAL